jgi:hypothetical protein
MYFCLVLIMRYTQKQGVKETPQDALEQENIRRKTNFYLAVRGMSFVTYGSGRYLNLGPVERRMPARS